MILPLVSDQRGAQEGRRRGQRGGRGRRNGRGGRRGGQRGRGREGLVGRGGNRVGNGLEVFNRGCKVWEGAMMYCWRHC